MKKVFRLAIICLGALLSMIAMVTVASASPSFTHRPEVPKELLNK